MDANSIMWQISQCVGEIATYLPVEGAFLMWSSRFINRQFGAATHYNCELSRRLHGDTTLTDAAHNRLLHHADHRNGRNFCLCVSLQICFLKAHTDALNR